ncbi:Protein phosphatase Slingshot 2 [Mactra antiquata]
MALVTVQRSPSPSASVETEEQDVLDTSESNLKSPRQKRRRSKSALKKLRKLFNTVRFVTKLRPCFSESYFTVKGAALILPQSEETSAITGAKKVSKSHAGDEIQGHLQAMFSVLRPQDIIKVAVSLEGSHTRYLAVVSCIGRQDTEESVLLGMDLLDKPHIGLILPVYAHMKIQLDGDGGFSIESDSHMNIFKPVSVQAMWSALQSLNKVVATAKENMYIPRGLTHTWIGYYESKVTSDPCLITEWNITPDIDKSYRTEKAQNLTTYSNTKKSIRQTQSAPVDTSTLEHYFREEDIYKLIRHELRNVMMTVDLEEVTCIFLRKSIEAKIGRDLKSYRSFIDTEMMEILGQMDAPSKILDHLYLGSEWNASNLEELQENGVHYILNISKEIDNFFPGVLHYMNIREWDVEKTDLLPYWEDTHRFINRARRHRSKTLVHCKMGISRSGSTVIAYLMKEKKWRLQEAYDFCKSKRSIVNPNPGFWKQLETYEGILNASWQREKFNQPVLNKPIPPSEDGLEIPEDISDDLLAVKLGGDGSHSNQESFIRAEQDIELASRSADSTEESLPDQLSPESAQHSEKSKFKYKSGKHKKQSTDNLVSDSESSETDSMTTDSDDVSTEDEETKEALDGANKESIKKETENKGFVPIDIPELRIDSGSDSKHVVKVEGRRCKSEGDSTLLSADDSRSPFSREGSMTKYKPDGSWIKLTPDESDKSDTNEDDGDIAKDDKPSDVDKENMDDSKDIDDGIVINITAENTNDDVGDSGVKVAVSNATETDANDESDHEKKDTVDTKGATEMYEKESIPWHPGMVKKQTKDIESKYGSGHSPTDKKRESTDVKLEPSDKKTVSDDVKSESDESKIESTGSEVCHNKTSEDTPHANLNIDCAHDTVENVIEKEATSENQPESHDISNQSEDSICNSAENTTADDINTAGSSPVSSEMKKSVYEEEEIDLPEGIVRKTTMEIEERNRIMLELNGKTLKRSSSLKSTRVTPKSKDRDNERRKTCIALLSPTHPDYTERDQIFASTSNQSDDDDLDQENALSSEATDNQEEEVTSQTGSIKVYKFMGEEVTVEEGLVRKQTQDIESKRTEQVVSHSVKSESGQTSHEQCSSPVGLKVSKQSSVPSEQKVKDVSNVSSTAQESSESSETVSVAPSESVKPDMKPESFDKVVLRSSPTSSVLRSSPSSSTHSMVTPKKQSRPESRFDPETLELIREIGSALLNSPAKSQLEDDESEELKEGDSLVSHYVRKIERNSQSRRKTAGREIIIIDKPCVSKEKTCKETVKGAVNTNVRPEISEERTVSPTSKVMTFSSKAAFPSNTDSKDSENIITESKHIDSKWSPVSSVRKCINVSEEVTTSDQSIICDNKSISNKADGKKQKFELELEHKARTQEKKSGAKSDNSDVSNDEDHEVCSVKKLLDKFEHPADQQTTGKISPTGSMSPSSNSRSMSFSGATGHSESFKSVLSPKQSPSSTFARIPTPEVNDPAQLFPSSRSPLFHRQSEPVINLSEKSLNVFEAKLNQIGSTLYQNSTKPDDLKTERSNQGQGQTFRPKSASYSQTDSTGRRQFFRTSSTLSGSELDNQQQFTWEGKKVRKSYGKTHPLAKLEGRRYDETKRKSPFYNTM